MLDTKYNRNIMFEQLSVSESKRLDVLEMYEILDTKPEEVYDDMTLLASHICQTPIALVSFVASERQWFKSNIGFPVGETPRDASLCSEAIAGEDDLLVIQDIPSDPRFANHPFANQFKEIRFYAGAKLVTQDGFALGTLCVLDRVPHSLTSGQIIALKSLRHQVVIALELRYNQRQLAASVENYRLQSEELARSRQEYKTLFDNARDIIYRTDNAGNITFFNDIAISLLGFSKQEILGKNFLEFIVPESRNDIQALYETQYRKKTPGTYFEVPVLTKDKKKLWLGQNVQILLEHGTVIGFQAVARNITERKIWEEERERLIKDLEEALEKVKMLSGLLPICSACKKIRDDKGYWQQVESYLGEHSDAKFTHSICPECMVRLYPNYVKRK